VGNWPETLEQGTNGFLFDPESAASVVSALIAAAGSTADWRRNAGQRSRAIAEERFEPVAAVDRFIESLSGLLRLVPAPS
jgi:glycosyltransferase involved in cell wall biosynthesis